MAKTPIVRPSPGQVGFLAVLRPGEDAWLESEWLGLETRSGEETDPDTYELWFQASRAMEAFRVKADLELNADEVAIFDTTGPKPSLNVASFRPQTTQPPPLPARGAPSEAGLQDWIPNVLRVTAAHEGKYDSVQRNLDGQGVSFGILQWTQRGGGLHVVLQAMAERDPAAFQRIFGPMSAELLDHTWKKALTPLGGALLWDEPWLSRFKAAGRYGTFQVAQDEAAASSSYMKAAAAIVEELGIPTERAMAVAFDRAVHQGPQTALRFAQGLSLPAGLDPTEVLVRYVQACAAKYRSSSPMSGKGWVRKESEARLKADGTVVTVTGPVWHLQTGPFDLWQIIMLRTGTLLQDPTLRDEAIDLGQIPEG